MAAGQDTFVLDLHGAFLRRVDLKGTILKGTDLTGAKNLTPEQLAQAVLDEHTKLPEYLAGKLPIAAE